MLACNSVFHFKDFAVSSLCRFNGMQCYFVLLALQLEKCRNVQGSLVAYYASVQGDRCLQPKSKLKVLLSGSSEGLWVQ